jgi:hypothetical protein
MTKTELLTEDFATLGEAISHDLGAKMVKDFQDANPEATEWYYIGKNIISQILSQPDCVGIRFYNALNEEGKTTLVYVGVDSKGKSIYEYTVVGADGELSKDKAIVADRTILNWSDLKNL